VSSVSFAPLYILIALVLLVLGFAVFRRLAGGRYAENLIARGIRIPTLRRLAVRSYVKELEKTNPVAARALEKVERVSGNRSGAPGEAALSVLTEVERRAYLGLFDDQAPRPLNRAQRRHAAEPKRQRYRRTIR